MTTVISVENLSKSYRLGQIGTGTFAHDLNVWWAKMRGKPNPVLRIGETDHGNRDGEEIWALKDVNFTVEQGEVLGIIGRNGAGKSTLLKILSRVTAPTSGRVKVKGRVASLLEVGTGFHPELTGRENIYLNGAILGMSRKEIDRKFDEIVDFSGVEKFIDTPVKRYSSGMYVRLAFAVAAHLDPEILVVDEVLAVGDAEFQKKCLGKMGDVAQEGRTVLFVSHNMVAIKELCGNCLWIEKGGSREMGDARIVVESYLQKSIMQKKNNSFEDVAVIQNRSIRLLSYVVTNHFGQTKPIPTTNEDIVINIRLQVNDPIKQPAFGINIRNSSGILMTAVTTAEQGITLSPLGIGEMEIKVKLLRVAFLPGTYTASFWVMNPQGDIYAMAKDAMAFDVGPSLLYGVSQVDQNWGCVYTEIEFDSTVHKE